jgi:hypothetical protein
MSSKQRQKMERRCFKKLRRIGNQFLSPNLNLRAHLSPSKTITSEECHLFHAHGLALVTKKTIGLILWCSNHSYFGGFAGMYSNGVRS